MIQVFAGEKVYVHEWGNGGPKKLIRHLRFEPGCLIADTKPFLLRCLTFLKVSFFCKKGLMETRAGQNRVLQSRRTGPSKFPWNLGVHPELTVTEAGPQGTAIWISRPDSKARYEGPHWPQAWLCASHPLYFHVCPEWVALTQKEEKKL